MNFQIGGRAENASRLVECRATTSPAWYVLEGSARRMPEVVDVTTCEFAQARMSKENAPLDVLYRDRQAKMVSSD